MQSKHTSLADRYIKYALSRASSERNDQLASLSQEQFMAISLEDRDIAWLGHCINRCPAYKIEADIARAVTDLFRNKYANLSKAKQFTSHLEKDPKTYASPFPVMWLEWESDKEEEESLCNGILVEKLSVGIRVTLFALHPESGVYPTFYTPISIAQGAPTDMGITRLYPKDTPAHSNAALIEEKESRHQQQIMQEAYALALCALTVLNSRKDIKLVPATEFVNQQKTIEDKPAENPNTKPIGLLTSNRSRNLQLRTGNIIELMKQEQQELALMMEARKSSDTELVIKPDVKPSKPGLLSRITNVFTRAQETSLASQVIGYGISTASEMRNSDLSMLSLEELLEVPQGERDHAWFAHCIQQSPGYIWDKNFKEALVEFDRKTYVDAALRDNLFQTLSKHPELYTPPVPTLWIEFNSASDKSTDFSKIAYLLTRLPGNKPGLQITDFYLHDEHGVMPKKGNHIIHSISESIDSKMEVKFYKDNVSFEFQGEQHAIYVRDVRHAIYFVAALNDPLQPLKLTPPLSVPLLLEGVTP